MPMTIGSLTDYYKLFASPVQKSQSSSIANFIYSAKAGELYSKSFARAASSSMSSYLTSLSSNINDLKNAAKPFTSKGPDSSFNQKSVSSGGSTAVSGTAASNASEKSYTLNISQLAQSQKNSGSKLNSGEMSFNQGTNTFSIKVGNSAAKNISFNLGASDTNKTALEKMAGAINSSKSGVTASVVSDTKAGTSYLQVVSDKTGTENGFEVTDVTGNTVTASGIGTVTEQAQNASYTVDGKQYTSQSNKISLDYGKVSLTLNKAEGKDINVAVGTDTKAITSDIEDFVRSYNNLVSFANKDSDTFSGAQKIPEELSKIIKSRTVSLASAGIGVQTDGTLSIDYDKLDKALESGSLKIKDLFTGNYGVAARITSKTNEILASPMQYAKPAAVSSNFNSFSNYLAVANTAIRYPGYGNAGMLFDMLL